MLHRRGVSSSVVAALFALTLAIPAVAQSAPKDLSRIHIDNFGMVNTNYYRGSLYLFGVQTAVPVIGST